MGAAQQCTSPVCFTPPPTATLDLLLFVPLKLVLEMAGGPHYLLFVILTVHVQHKQVIAQAADGDACNREWLFDTNTTPPGFLHALQNLSQERSNCWSHSEKPAS